MAVGAGGLVLLTGCVSGLGLDRDAAVYGVGVVRPGMPENEVSQLLGPSDSRNSMGTPDQSEVIYATGLHVRYSAGVVQSCWNERVGTRGAADAKFADGMKPGIPPSEVAEHLGTPTFGYVNGSGSVVLRYARPGVEVCFTDGRLTRWWTTDDRPPVTVTGQGPRRAPPAPSASNRPE